MSEKLVELWERAGALDKSPAEFEYDLAELNQELDWDRRNLTSTSGSERERLPADD
jgi:hypothetical protein